MIDSLTNDEEISPTKKVKSDFISSLLEDEKEIDEYLKEKAIKRANTITKKHKSAFNIYSSYNGQNGNNKGKIKGNRLSSSFLKKVNTIGNNKFFRKKRENEEEEKNNIKKRETEPMEKAYQKASDLAEFWNVKLGDPISIIENRSYDYAVSTANYAMAKMAYDDVDEEAEISVWVELLSILV